MPSMEHPLVESVNNTIWNVVKFEDDSYNSYIDIKGPDLPNITPGGAHNKVGAELDHMLVHHGYRIFGFLDIRDRDKEGSWRIFIDEY